MIEIYCDGGSRGNPGPAAFGFVVKVDGQTVKEDSGYIGIATNNFAEYTALIKVLSWLKESYQGKDLHIYLDSQLVVSQISGIWKIKNPNIRNLVFKVRELESSFGQIAYKHVLREQNKEADRLVNQALDQLKF